MVKGTGKGFSEKKGFGFLSRDNGIDLFVHHTGIVGEGFNNLREGDAVEFEITDGPRGPQANCVRVM